MNLDKERVKLYRDRIISVLRDDIKTIPDISVVVVAHKYKPEMIENLAKLKDQIDVESEIIFVNNGSDDLISQYIQDSVDVYVQLADNYGAYMSRNIGSLFALGNIIVFIDDDGIPKHDTYLKSFMDCFTKYEIVAVRGKCEAHEGIVPAFYDCGPNVYPAYPTLEGNCAFIKHDFFNVGGWDDGILFGGGGLEIGCRFIEAGYPYHKFIYSPDPVLIHTYAMDQNSLYKKQQRQMQGRERLKEQHESWKQILHTWADIAGRSELVVERCMPKMAAVVKKEKRPDIRDILKFFNFKYTEDRFIMHNCSEKVVVKCMMDGGFSPYYKKITEPRIIEFRRKKEKYLVEIAPRR